ncbi:MAG: RnfABCDGE type electron transport complex subunit D [Pseudomonadota bacterium]
MPKDPRLFQIAALTSLLLFGLTARAFEIPLLHIAAIFGAAIATQAAGAMLHAIKIDLRSPVITALSLTLLLRADSAWPLAAAAAIAIGSKFLLRINDKHIFNPANIGIVAMTLTTNAAWTTPGQWGTAVWLAALMAGAGFFVAYRAARLDVPLIFLGAFATLIIARALYLGDPLSIPVLRLQNGALVLFAFFMISDPKTTPDGAIARAAFSIGAAMLAYFFIYHRHELDGLFYALAIATIARPALDALQPARRHQWGDAPRPRNSSTLNGRSAPPLLMRPIRETAHDA